MRRLPLVLVPALVIAGIVAFFTQAWPIIAASQPPVTPPQPLFFDHSVHVQTAGLDCAFCHRTATQAATAGYPDVEQCMFCHGAVGPGTPQAAEIEKLRSAWTTQQPIEWVRIHRMPDHVHFVHEAHLRAGLTCATCHGDVGTMGQVVQVRPLNMGDCVTCHQQYGAPTECGVCHY